MRTRARKYGPVLDEQVLSIRRDIVITGPNACGKSRWLTKLHLRCGEIWPKRPTLYVRSMEPLQSWFEDPRIAAYAEQQGRPWAKLRSYERVDMLIEWIAEEKAVLMLDDAHKLAGRKLDIAVRMATRSRILVVGAFAHQSIPMSLRLLMDQRNPQRIALRGEAAYDATSIAMWLLLLITMAAGWWQLAAVLGGMKVLAGGRGAAKQT
ncbi:hypothetical protein GT347_27190 (plasmid) [Xylophilus rhododendri]|uniref:AAA+ ATPase domain-containing protein n=1 Tax=Xylophilus rhododendri TaxID=2697032 RepID=A0A857JCM5_9BURK|nr:hypothetical protein GT347_27190 [Xylophilus rhododendri]